MAKGLVLAFHKEENSELFESILLALKARYSLLSAARLKQLLSEGVSTNNVCHITFDDGLESFYSVVFPLLKKYQVPASLFVSPEIISTGDNFWFQETEDYKEEVIKDIQAKELHISATKLAAFSSQAVFKCLPVGEIKKIIALYQQQENCGKKPSQNMSIEQLKEVDHSGLVTVGAHTINHPVLTNEDNDSCIYEIGESVTALAKLLEHPVRYFAYPNGRPGIDFGEREMNCLRRNNIAMAFSTELDTLSRGNDLLSIPRMGFARMGLSPSNPLIKLRMNLGKKWVDIKSIGQPTEKEIRERIKTILAG